MSIEIRKHIDALKSELLKENNNNKIFGYHVTRRENLKSIKKIGLEPRVPQDYGENGDTKGVYLFKTIDDTKNALYNWLGERIDEWEEDNNEEYDEIVLKVDLTGLEENLIDSVEFEWTCLINIKPSRIVSVFEM